MSADRAHTDVTWRNLHKLSHGEYLNHPVGTVAVDSSKTFCIVAQGDAGPFVAYLGRDMGVGSPHPDPTNVGYIVTKVWRPNVN